MGTYREKFIRERRRSRSAWLSIGVTVFLVAILVTVGVRFGDLADTPPDTSGILEVEGDTVRVVGTDVAFPVAPPAQTYRILLVGLMPATPAEVTAYLQEQMPDRKFEVVSLSTPTHTFDQLARLISGAALYGPSLVVINPRVGDPILSEEAHKALTHSMLARQQVMPLFPEGQVPEIYEVNMPISILDDPLKPKRFLHELAEFNAKPTGDGGGEPDPAVAAHLHDEVRWALYYQLGMQTRRLSAANARAIVLGPEPLAVDAPLHEWNRLPVEDAHQIARSANYAFRTTKNITSAEDRSPAQAFAEWIGYNL
ncbi:MAG: hypothetical protein H6684_11065 [Deltaproteobacteria bacterium]|nr:hypothetical protein [Deltaproteobacteria bacterium]